MKAVPRSNNLTANFGLTSFGRTVAHADNKGFAIAGLPCFADTFVQGESSVLRIKFSAKTPRHRKPTNHSVFQYFVSVNSLS